MSGNDYTKLHHYSFPNAATPRHFLGIDQEEIRSSSVICDTPPTPTLLGYSGGDLMDPNPKFIDISLADQSLSPTANLTKVNYPPQFPNFIYKRSGSITRMNDIIEEDSIFEFLKRHSRDDDSYSSDSISNDEDDENDTPNVTPSGKPRKRSIEKFVTNIFKKAY